MMRRTCQVTGGLALIGIALAMLSVWPDEVVGLGGAELAPHATQLAPPPPGRPEFPPQHTANCDFSSYRPIRISDWSPQGVLKSVKPRYPEHARSRGICGTVTVLVLIDKEGTVERVCSRGPKALQPATEWAAVEWRFRRPTINEGVDPFGYIERLLESKFVLGGEPAFPAKPK